MRRLATLKNPHFTPEEETRIEEAEVKGTRATIYELGVGEFLKSHMPCGIEIATARDVLTDALQLRAEGHAIHQSLKTRPARGYKHGVKKSA